MPYKTLINKLKKNNLKISIAESCTGGRICYELTKIPGVSKVFLFGAVVYSNKAKINILKIKKSKLDKFGAVSKIIAKEMSSNIMKISKSDFSISTTGISGPTGRTIKKPIGLTYIGISTKYNTYVFKKKFKGSRIDIQKKASKSAISLLMKIIN